MLREETRSAESKRDFVTSMIKTYSPKRASWVAVIASALDVSLMSLALSEAEDLDATEMFTFEDETARAIADCVPVLASAARKPNSLLTWALRLTSLPWSPQLAPACLQVTELVIRSTDRQALKQRLDALHLLDYALCTTCAPLRDPLLAALLATGAYKGEAQCLLEAMNRAVSSGTARQLEMLLRAGADPNHINFLGENALHWLAKTEMPQTAEKLRLLLEAGAELERKDTGGETPLCHSLMSTAGSLSAFDALVAAGADVRVLGQAIVGLNTDSGGTQIRYLLPIVILKGDTGGLRRLLDPAIVPRGVINLQQADPEIAQKWTPLVICAATDRHHMAAMLLQAGAAVNAGAQDMTPMQFAVTFSACHTAKVLVKAGGLARSGDGSRTRLLKLSRLVAKDDSWHKTNAELVSELTRGGYKRSTTEIRQSAEKLVAYLEGLESP